MLLWLFWFWFLSRTLDALEGRFAPLPPRIVVVVLLGVLVVRDAVLNVVPRSCPRFCEHRVLSTNEVLPYAHQSEFDLQDTCLELPSERLSSPKKTATPTL